MITYPNCKINLGLHVVGKRPDGYHDLETIFLPVHSLCDELEISEFSPTPNPSLEGGEVLDTKPATKTGNIIPSLQGGAGVGGACRLTVEGIKLDGPTEDNLCMRAWHLLHDEFGTPPVSIRLKKGIPFGAGLGGGSSDAAFTLKMLNGMFALGLSDSQLEKRAAKLGADCAFFIKNQAAYATGIGEILSPIDIDLSAYRIAIEIPHGEHVSTREAYAGLNRASSSSPKLGEVAAQRADGGVCRPDLREAIKQPIGEWRGLIVNDFEASVFPSHPAIATLKENMYARGALYASMTGSGAAVFGIFPA